MNIRKRFIDMVDEGMDIRPWLLFVLAIVIAAFSASAVFVQSIGEGIGMYEVDLLRGGSISLIGGIEISPLLSQSLLSLGLLNLPLTSLELATVFQIALAVVAAALLFKLVRIYYSARYGFLAVLVISTSAVYLSTVTLLGSIWLGFLVLTGTILALLQLRRRHWTGFVSLPILAGALVSFQTVGIVLALLSIAAITYSIKKDRLKRPSWRVIAGMIVSFVLVIGGYWSLISQIGLDQFISQLNTPALDVFINNITLHITGGANPFDWPSNWPLWNIAYLSTTLLGFAVAIKRRQAQRYKLSLALSAVYVLSLTLPYTDMSIALGSLVSVLLITAAIRYLIQSWGVMLPRNRVRHLISGVLVAAIVLVMMNGALTRQFIIRPSTDYSDMLIPVDTSRNLYQDFRQTPTDTL